MQNKSRCLMKTYYVENSAAWFLVNAENVASARSEGIKYFGCSTVKARLATAAEKRYFVSLKSEISEAHSR